MKSLKFRKIHSVSHQTSRKKIFCFVFCFNLSMQKVKNSKDPLQKENQKNLILFKNCSDTEIRMPAYQKSHQKSHFQNQAKLENIENFSKEQKITFWNKMKASFTYILSLIFCCFFRRYRRVSIVKIETKNYNSSILNFFKHLLWILRAIRYFRDKTVYRTLKRIKDFHIFLINDATYFKSEEGDENRTGITKFFSSSSIRKILRLFF